MSARQIHVIENNDRCTDMQPLANAKKLITCHSHTNGVHIFSHMVILWAKLAVRGSDCNILTNQPILIHSLAF